MKRALFLALVVAAPLAWAQSLDETAHHFVDLPSQKLSVVDTSDEWALVEAKDGTSAVLVRLGDVLGRDRLKVTRISKGCLWLSRQADTAQMCVDTQASPRS